MEAAGILIPLIVAGAVAALLALPVAGLATKLDVVDRPSERSVAHRSNIPLLGGLAVAGGFAAGLAAGLWLLAPEVSISHLGGMAVGCIVILAVGVWDDHTDLSPWAKLAGQIAAAVVAISAGFQMGHITEPVSRQTIFLPEPVVWIASIFWIVGITNAMNLIDGLDGLATGVGAIICATLTLILVQAGQPFGVCLGVALLGGLIGFLPHNFPPARIFLGDTGALFMGYMLALLSLEGYRQVTVITFVVPLLALAIPLLDTALSIVRRARTGQSPFRADRLHLHHRLLAARGTPRAAVLQFYFLTACFSLIAVSFTDLEGYVAGACLVIVLILTLRMLANLGVLSFSAEDELATGEAPSGAEEEKT